MAAQVSQNLLRRIAELETAASKDCDDCFALAMLLFEHGCHNELLPGTQRVELCTRALEWLLACGQKLPAEDSRRPAVAAALAMLGAELAMRGSGRPKVPHLRAVEPAG